MTNSVDNQEVIIFEISYDNEDNLELRSESVVIEKDVLEDDTKNIIQRKVHTCDTCGSKFHDKYDLKRHQIVHTKEKQYFCSFCTLTFALRHHVKRHESTHISKGHTIKLETSEMIHFCRYCKKDFIGPENLRIHEKTHSSKGEVMKCKFCDKSFTVVTIFVSTKLFVCLFE